jgi:hypothetical protein
VLSERLFRTLLQLNKNHASGAHLLGRMLAERLRKVLNNTVQKQSAETADAVNEICELYETASRLLQDVSVLPSSVFRVRICCFRQPML